MPGGIRFEMVEIGNVKINGISVLAPMAGVTDIGFRTVCRECGAAYTYTEMVSAKALVYQDKKTVTLLELGQDEHPAAAQIFGSEPEVMAKAAVKAAELSKADIIDINMGCPMGKVVKNGDGSALMKDIELSARIISSVSSAVNVPVTVKIRKGWDKGNVNAVEFARMAEESGAKAIAVHGRTRAQLYSGNADWNIIAAVKKAVSIPVIANGDVFSAHDAMRMLKWTGADLVMVGRGCMGNPWLFRDIEALAAGKELPPEPSVEEKCDMAVRQFEIAARHKREKSVCLEARKHYAWYLSGVPYSGYFKRRISKIENFEDIYAITREIKQSLGGETVDQRRRTGIDTQDHCGRYNAF